MNETDIRKYAELMKELGLTGLEINDEANRFSIRLECNCRTERASRIYFLSTGTNCIR